MARTIALSLHQATDVSFGGSRTRDQSHFSGRATACTRPRSPTKRSQNRHRTVTGSSQTRHGTANGPSTDHDRTMTGPSRGHMRPSTDRHETVTKHITVLGTTLGYPTDTSTHQTCVLDCRSVGRSWDLWSSDHQLTPAPFDRQDFELIIINRKLKT